MNPSTSTATVDCSCTEQKGLSRRTFLRGSLATAAVVAGSGLLDLGSAQVALADPGYAGDTLVVVSLRGGFDGLSAIVPAGDPGYAAARPHIAVPTSRLIGLDDRFGMHPALAPLEPFWRAGTFGAVHAVGQTDPTRSHFAAMEQLERAAPGSSLRTGWIDRMVGVTGTASTFATLQLGSGTAGSAFAGPSAELAMKKLEDFELSGAWDDREHARWRDALRGMHEGGPQHLVSAARTTLDAVDAARALPAAGELPPGVDYPRGEFGEGLRDLARLIKAGVGVRVAAVDLGGWDMHEWIGSVDGGRMVEALQTLGQGLAAFATDLGEAFSRTSIVTLSEFGRRVEQNGSGGLDHGNGNAVLVMGGGIAGGKVHGRWPGLSGAALLDGDLAGTTDYRAILAEILERRCGVTSSSVFPGLDRGRVGVVRA